VVLKELFFVMFWDFVGVFLSGGGEVFGGGYIFGIFFLIFLGYSFLNRFFAVFC
jgi:hypothetical protein